MRISDWSSDVCSSDLFAVEIPGSRIRRATGAMSQANVFWRGDVTGFFDGWAMVLVAVVVVDPHVAGGGPNTGSHQSPVAPRSEERRVGKVRVSKCRSRWSPNH